eukprot:GHVS01025544.1.p1 GENE.GHVS01025544.1~~GHVS01025544.1.p1  ORF type:complete len:250 (+),score=81.93 GHVS01025544.1:112-750(+)
MSTPPSSSTGSSSGCSAAATANVDDLIASASDLMGDGSYQIVPLTLPNKQNNYNAINCYVDAVGKVKELDRNAKASRLTSDDIYGDCFLCRTFDDDVSEFGRLDMSLSDFNKMMETPPNKSGRWDQTKAVEQMFAGGGGGVTTTTTTDKVMSTAVVKDCCENCGKKAHKETEEHQQPTVVVQLRKCGKCGKARYCSRQCQLDDWKFHKRVCG